MLIKVHNDSRFYVKVYFLSDPNEQQVAQVNPNAGIQFGVMNPLQMNVGVGFQMANKQIVPSSFNAPPHEYTEMDPYGHKKVLATAFALAQHGYIVLFQNRPFKRSWFSTKDELTITDKMIHDAAKAHCNIHKELPENPYVQLTQTASDTNLASMGSEKLLVPKVVSVEKQQPVLGIPLQQETAAPTNTSIDELCQIVLHGDLIALQRHQTAVAANINKGESKAGRSMLYTAARAGYLDICVYLVETHRTSLKEALNQHGSTPLHAAAYAGHYAIVEYFLEKGADPTIKNKAGRTAQQEAGTLTGLHKNARADVVSLFDPSHDPYHFAVEPRLRTSHCASSGFLVPYVTWQNPSAAEQVLDQNSEEFKAVARCMSWSISKDHDWYRADPIKGYNIRLVKGL